jgi:hypothetical protein
MTAMLSTVLRRRASRFLPVLVRSDVAGLNDARCLSTQLAMPVLVKSHAVGVTNARCFSTQLAMEDPIEDPMDDTTHREGVFGVEPLLETGEWAGCKRGFMAPLKISVKGADILTEPLFNKGTAFKSGERDRLRLRGLLPSRVMNIGLQKERFLVALRAEESDIKKNILLEDLHDRNETLYHRVLIDHIDEMAPLIYTPVVGQACMDFAARFRRPRGMYFTKEDRGHMAASKLYYTRKYMFVLTT